MNHPINYLLQEIFNLVPDILNQDFVKSMNTNTNDQVSKKILSKQKILVLTKWLVSLDVDSLRSCPHTIYNCSSQFDQ